MLNPSSSQISLLLLNNKMHRKYIGLLNLANLKQLASKLNSVIFELPYFSSLVLEYLRCFIQRFQVFLKVMKSMLKKGSPCS